MPAKDEFPPARIEAIRASLQLTQQELANALGVKIRAVQHWLYTGDDPALKRSPRGAARKLLEQLEARGKTRRVHSR